MKKMSENIVNIQSEISCPNEIENVRQKGSGYLFEKRYFLKLIYYTDFWLIA